MADRRSATKHECPEETTARSTGGPGPVLDQEEVARLLYRDDHLTADGRLTPAALPTSDLLEPEREGLSVGRLVHLTAHDIRRLVAERERRAPANRFSGGGVAMTADVRNLRTRDGQRELCVVDDPREGFDAHALVRLANPGAYNRGSVRRLRERLIDLFSLRPARALLDLNR